LAEAEGARDALLMMALRVAQAALAVRLSARSRFKEQKL
jgi:hypothetical protein